MDFFKKKLIVKQNSTLPEVKFPLTTRIMEKYDITDEMLEDVAVTFSMIDTDSGVYRIANVEASLVISDCEPQKLDECKYTLVYRFKLRDTRKPGNFRGEFKLDFLGDFCGKITLPNDTLYQIIIQPSITKTSVI